MLKTENKMSIAPENQYLTESFFLSEKERKVLRKNLTTNTIQDQKITKVRVDKIFF
jgi:hypothetical protein